MAIDITVAITDSARVGEGPFWDSETRRLCWVDILGGNIHISDPDSEERETITLPTLVGAAVPKTSGGFVAATSEGFTDIDSDGSWATRVRVLPPGQRMNDAKCDAAGRLWAGSTDMDFAPGRGALHVLTAAWHSEQILGDLTLPNGLGWSPDGRTFYLIDTIAGELNAFDVRPDQVAPMNRRLLARFPDSGGLPDGMTIDTDGCLWIAMWGGSRIVRVSPEGRTVATIPLSVAQPSSCAFGGPDLDILYVTTAREGLQLKPADIAGSVLAIRGLPARGLPARRFHG